MFVYGNPISLIDANGYSTTTGGNKGLAQGEAPNGGFNGVPFGLGDGGNDSGGSNSPSSSDTSPSAPSTDTSTPGADADATGANGDGTGDGGDGGPSGGPPPGTSNTGPGGYLTGLNSEQNDYAAGIALSAQYIGQPSLSAPVNYESLYINTFNKADYYSKLGTAWSSLGLAATLIGMPEVAVFSSYTAAYCDSIALVSNLQNGANAEEVALAFGAVGIDALAIAAPPVKLFSKSAHYTKSGAFAVNVFSKSNKSVKAGMFASKANVKALDLGWASPSPAYGIANIFFGFFKGEDNE